MGMYTEFHFNVELQSDTPPLVLDILEQMASGDTADEDIPTMAHPLFETDRWRWMLRSDSFYFASQTESRLHRIKYSWKDGDMYYLGIRCNLKNYCDEIQKFIDWIYPYVDALEGEFLGFYRVEQSELPTIIRYGRTGMELGDVIVEKWRAA